jgi:hypothetical protein
MLDVSATSSASLRSLRTAVDMTKRLASTTVPRPWPELWGRADEQLPLHTHSSPERSRRTSLTPKNKSPLPWDGGLCLQDSHLLYTVSGHTNRLGEWKDNKAFNRYDVEFCQCFTFCERTGLGDRSGNRFRLRYESDHSLAQPQDKFANK